MNRNDWICLLTTILFIIAGISAWVIYFRAKREFVKSLIEPTDTDNDGGVMIKDIYSFTTLLQDKMLKMENELYEERKNMSCEELGTISGERFAKKFENFSIAVDMIGDVREYLRRSMEEENA